MQCDCPHCGDRMAKVEAGMQSRCVCPNPDCAFECAICLGLSTTPLNSEQVKLWYALHAGKEE